MGESPRPSGDVTFFFTDIEGSTKLWEDHPEEMKRALARHDALIRGEIESRGGYVFKTVGDAFCAAFSSPRDALSAAIASQLALQTESWPGIGTLRIRIALHSGKAEERDGDYFGPDVNRVARLLGLARGGHTLLSGEARGHAGESLPPGAALNDLGEHFLRDVKEPVRVFNLLHPDLPSDFPLAKVSDPSLHNLPAQLSGFVGREKEMAEVKRLVSSSRLVTLAGAGGSGKTRLALEAAGRLVSAFQEGARFVDLAPLSDPAFVPQETARALGLLEDSGTAIISTLVEQLKGKHLLILLDNCEHLIDACARLSESLLRFCPQLRILATSRQPLGVAGEAVYRVPSLAAPDPAGNFEPEQIERFESVKLFVERARTSSPGFTLTAQSAAAVAQICTQLDGIPLAIELAAARMKMLSAEQIADRLKDSFRLLAGGSRTALPRHQTLLATMDWSHSHLLEPERILFRRLSVFSGGFSLEACEAICSGNGIERLEVLDLLSQLVDKSLVAWDEKETRYRLLVPVREYAAEKLAASGEDGSLRDLHRDFFAALAEEGDAELTGPRATGWLDRLEREHDNLRAALAWCEKNPDGALRLLQLSGALWKFWYQGYLSEARRWLDAAIARDSDTFPAPLRARAYLGAGTIAWRQNDYVRVNEYCSKSLELFKTSGIAIGVAYSLSSLGSVANFCGDYPEAEKLFIESHRLFVEMQDPFGVALSSIELGMVYHWKTDFDRAEEFLNKGIGIAKELGHVWCHAFGLATLGHLKRSAGDGAVAKTLLDESLAMRKTMQDRPGIADSLSILGMTLMDAGDLAGAASMLQQGFKLADEIGWPWMMGFALDGLARVEFARGARESALDLHRQALLVRRRVGDARGIAESLEGCAAALSLAGEPLQAVRLLAAASRSRGKLGAPLAPADSGRVERCEAALREKLGGEFDAAWRGGLELDAAAAAGEALQEQTDHS